MGYITHLSKINISKVDEKKDFVSTNMAYTLSSAENDQQYILLIMIKI